MLFKPADGPADYPHAFLLRRESYTSEARFLAVYAQAETWCRSKFGGDGDRCVSDGFTIAFASSDDADAFFHTLVY